MATENPPSLRIQSVDDVLRSIPGREHDWLSVSEQARLDRLRVVSRRRQYLAGHWLLRTLLAEREGGEPVEWILAERLNQPPIAERTDAPQFFSLSHSGDWIAGAISEQPIGIDIEARSPARDALQSFRHLLMASDEFAEDLSSDDLLLRWVLKEAWIKRDHGSALPDQLLRVVLSRVPDPSGNLRAISTGSLHIAVCSTSECRMELPEVPQIRSSWNATGSA